MHLMPTVCGIIWLQSNQTTVTLVMLFIMWTALYLQMEVPVVQPLTLEKVQISLSEGTARVEAELIS